MDPRTGKKFSKRDMTSMFGIENWLKQGYLREALLNYLMMLGWAPKDNRELFTLDEFIQAFDQSGIQKANPTFNPAKLDWYQGQYVRQLSLEQLYTALSDWFKTFAPDASMEYLFAADLKPQVISALGLLHERVVTFTELIGELNLFFTPPTQYEDLSEVKGLTDKVPAQLIPALHELKSVVSITDQEEWVSAIRALAAKSEWKDADMFMLLRVAIWGKRFSPPLFEAIQIVGVEGSVNRIESIRAHLQ